MQARTLAERTALHFRGEQHSFAALAQRATAGARALPRDGILPQSRIAILDKNHSAYLELLFAAAKAGAVLVPVNYRLALPEILFILKDADVEMLFIGAELAAESAVWRSELPQLRRVIYLDGTGDDSYEQWLQSASGAPPGQLPIPAASDVLLQCYTSGTTGHVKGALLTHHNLLALLTQAQSHWCTWQDDDRCLVPLPLFHIAGLGWALIAWFCGVPGVLLREAEPAATLRAIEEYHITKVLLVPALLRFLLDHPQLAHTELRSLRHMFYGASPIPEELLRRAMLAFDCGFGQVYGLTESTGTIAFLTADDHRHGPPTLLRSCGRPCPHVDIAIFDEHGQPQPSGTIGEICCRGSQVMTGYYKQPAETAAALQGGWLHTGDAGYLDPEGYLHIVDRIKDLIISGGENIYPAEVESVLASHAAVSEVAVIGIPDAVWGESVMAFVVAASGAVIDSEELIRFARARLASYKVPRRVALVQALPRNAGGKILKRELRAAFWQDQERQVH